MMKIKLKMMLFVAAVVAATSVWAEIKMPLIFGNDMMFQANKPVKVWGSATPNASVDVEFGWQKKSVKANDRGAWSVDLIPMKADKNGRELVVSENGVKAKTFSNILVGEIWVLGGQSNMEWRLVPTTDSDAAKKRANYPLIRCFQQDGTAMAKTPQGDSPKGSKWVICTPQTAPSFSGVGFYFAEQLQKDLDVPVGLVYTPLGATSMACWIPEKDFPKCKGLMGDLKDFRADESTYDFKKAMAAHKKKMDARAAVIAKAKAEGKQAPGVPWDYHIPPSQYSNRLSFKIPAYHFNAKVAPLGKFAVKGVLWYQGEGDSSGWRLDAFEEQFNILVNAWRELWQDSSMPFYWVQLTSYAPGKSWPEARWAQYKCLKSVKNGGMANIIDIGEKYEIHPRNKTDVGLRLEKIALRDAYGKDVRAYGPMFKNVRYSNAFAAVKFDADGSKIVGRGKPRGFEVLVGGEWKPCTAEIKPDYILLLSPDGRPIDGVRYLWTAWAQPDVWLFNEDGLPAISFVDLKKK